MSVLDDLDAEWRAEWDGLRWLGFRMHVKRCAHCGMIRCHWAGCPLEPKKK